MRVGKIRFQLQGRFEFLDGLCRLPFVFQRESQIVVRYRIVGLQLQGLVVSGDSGVPGLGAGQFGGLLAISLRRLRREEHGETYA